MKRFLKFVLAAVISLLALYLAFKNVPFDKIKTYMGTVDYFWIFPAVLAIVFSFFLRILRWKAILNATAQVTFVQAWHPLMAGFMFNCVLPARAGEVARPLMLKMKSDISFAKGAGSVVLERLFDLIFLVTFFFISIQFVDIDPDLEMKFGGLTLSRALLMGVLKKMYLMIFIIALFVALFALKSTRKMMYSFLNYIPGRAGDFFKEIVENLTSAFLFVKDMRLIVYCLALTVIIWTVAALSYFLMGFGFPGIDLSFLEMFFMMVVICFFISLPSVPGFWGLWEAGGVFVFALFGVSSAAAPAFTLINHAIQILPVIVLGFISFFVMGLNFRLLQKGFKRNHSGA